MGIKHFLIFICLLASSCATIDNLNPFNENENLAKQEVEYLTIETPACSRAVCKIANTSGDVYFMNTPNTINIKPSYQDFEVTCFVEEVKEYDDVLPMTMWLFAGNNYLKHDFACPLTDEEVIVKTKLENSPPQDSTLPQEPTSLKVENDAANNPVNAEELPAINIADSATQENETISQTNEQSSEANLSETQINAIAQLTELYERKMISEEIFNKEIIAIKQNL